MNLRHTSLVNKWVYVTPLCFVGWRHDFMKDRVALGSQFASGAGRNFGNFKSENNPVKIQKEIYL